MESVECVVGDDKLNLEMPEVSTPKRKWSTASEKSIITPDSDTSTSTRKKREIISYLVDIPVLLLGFFVIFLGIVCGVALFLILLQKENVEIQSTLSTTVQGLENFFASGVQELIIQISVVQHYFMDASNPKQVPMDRFIRMVDQTNIISNGVFEYLFVQKVSEAELASFNQELTSIYMDTAFAANFSAYDIKYPNGTTYLGPRDDQNYLVQKYYMPLDDHTAPNIGFCLDNDAVRGGGARKSISRLGVTVTEKVTLRRSFITEGFFIFAPVYNFTDPTQIFGVVRATVEAQSVITRLETDDVSVIVKDTNNNYQVIASTLTGAEHEMFKMVVNTTVIDRVWEVTFYASPSLIKKISDSNVGKWIALIIPIVISLIIFGIIVTFLIIKRLHFNRTKQKLLQEKLSLMHEGKEKLDVLMNKIAMEESKSRNLLNSIPYPIFTMNVKGDIQHVNAAFNETFHILLHQNTHFSTIMPMFSSIQQFENWLEQEQQKKNVLLSLELSDKFNRSHAYYIMVTKHMFQQVKHKEELFIVVLQNTNLQEQNVQYFKNLAVENVVDTSMVKQILGDATLLQEFKAFCAQEKNEEGILFLEDVFHYKQKSKVSSRVELQQQMKQKYLKQGAPKELNLPRQFLDSQLAKLQTGRIDDFDELEITVMDILSQDPLRRFLQFKQQTN